MSNDKLDFSAFDSAREEAMAESGLDTSAFDSALIDENVDISKLVTAASSGLQGTTAGLSDELLATYGALKEAATLEPLSPEQSKLQQFKQARQEYLPLIRKDIKEIEEANPKTALASEIVGGFALPAGALAKGAKGIAGATKAGAKIGALVGAGKSESDLLTGGEVGQLAIDTGIGSAVGAATGAGTQYGIEKAGPIISKGIDKISKFKLLRDLRKSYKAGLEGKKIFGIEGEKAILKDSESALDSMADDLVKLNKETNEIIKSGLEKGKKISTEDLIAQYNKIKQARNDTGLVVPSATKYYDKMIDDMEALLQIKKESIDIPQKEVSPQTLSRYATSMQDIGETALETTAGKSSEAAKQAFALKNMMEGKLRSDLPEYKKGMEQSYKLKSNLEDLLDKSQNILELSQNLDQNKFNIKLNDILKKSSTKGDADLKLDKFFDEMKQIDPTFVTKYEPKLRQLADDFMLNKTTTPKLDLTNLGSTASSLSRFGAYGTGRLLRAANVDKLYTRLSSIKNDPVAQELATILEKTIPKGEQARNAMIYSLSQNPAFREKIREYSSDLTDEE